MNNELYRKVFTQMNKLGAIRRDVYREEGGCMDIYKEQLPILSDCIKGIQKVHERLGMWRSECTEIVWNWDYLKPYLCQQSDELGNKLFELLS